MHVPRCLVCSKRRSVSRRAEARENNKKSMAAAVSYHRKLRFTTATCAGALLDLIEYVELHLCRSLGRLRPRSRFPKGGDRPNTNRNYLDYYPRYNRYLHCEPKLEDMAILPSRSTPNQGTPIHGTGLYSAQAPADCSAKLRNHRWCILVTPRNRKCETYHSQS
jgi:hypothetical protein